MFTQLRESFAHLMNRMGRGAALSLVFLLSAPLWVQSTARAEVIITEILANPETGTEWIELTTKGEETENISSFKLYDVVSSPSLLFTFPQDTILTAGVATVIEINPGKLNNAGDGLTLYTDQETISVAVSFGEATKGLSWQRTLESDTFFEETPTPGELLTAKPSSPIPSPISTPVPSDIPENIPSPIPSTNPTIIETVTEPTPSAQQTELENQVASLIASYAPSSFVLLTRATPQLATESAEPKTTTRKKDFTPPKSSAVSFMGGGILISSASYLALYVLEQKEIIF